MIYRFSFWLFFNYAYSFPARLVLGKRFFVHVYDLLIHSKAFSSLSASPSIFSLYFFFFLLCFVFT
jgi:hypothetical protein